MRLKLRMFVNHTIPLALLILSLAVTLTAQPTSAPTPLLDADTKVGWWFVFKFNSAWFPNSCAAAQRACPFGGTVQSYSRFSQQFSYASSDNHTLQSGGSCLGDWVTDPLGGHV